LTVLMHLLETGRVPLPKSLTVLYADTGWNCRRWPLRPARSWRSSPGAG
jgi:hypothetical protein